jgi:pSer/pThr/pTyr-binding forkhead associated (FHA) protein
MTAVDVGVSPAGQSEALRPRGRSPVAILIALDDDSEVEGETWRLRQTKTTIGRRQADLCFANDADMSASHAVIERSKTDHGEYRWRLSDLGSTNGCFVRLSSIQLSGEDVIMVGDTVCRWQMGASPDSKPQLSEVGSEKRIYRIRGRKPLVIGNSSREADIVLAQRTISQRHAVLRPAREGWILEDQNSRNGIWHQVKEFEFTGNASFILGEQRFLFRLPSVASTDHSLRGGESA